ncbi:hypothetical protein BpHYR1_019779 [Brachionus plicatilis]|uniref:Uncharacterized protein n=1 Tax=Brachionus plicatilis TaxID=10195 RepID=A0A3M7PRA4_BRAPC|nr:hypothetical protein BpHYR1_019779 [Brachionus plicatilis]
MVDRCFAQFLDHRRPELRHLTIDSAKQKFLPKFDNDFDISPITQIHIEKILLYQNMKLFFDLPKYLVSVSIVSTNLILITFLEYGGIGSTYFFLKHTANNKKFACTYLHIMEKAVDFKLKRIISTLAMSFKKSKNIKQELPEDSAMLTGIVSNIYQKSDDELSDEEENESSEEEEENDTRFHFEKLMNDSKNDIVDLEENSKFYQKQANKQHHKKLLINVLFFWLLALPFPVV